MKRLLQVMAGLLAAAVAFATLGPPSARPHLRYLGQDGEHALAFGLLGLAIGLAHSRRPYLTALIAVALTGVIELLQIFAPGRHARLSDFIVDALALGAGLALAAAARYGLVRRKAPRPV